MRNLLLQLHPEESISGMAIGIDQDFAWTCLELGLPWTAAVPFKGQESTWPDAAQRDYHELISLATRVVYASEPGYAPWKMHKRNRWMTDEIGEDGTVIAVWDGSPGGTSSAVKYATEVGRRILRIDPDAVAREMFG